MAAEAPSWADQWGAGGFGATPEEEPVQKKEARPSALGKAKAAVAGGTHKIKNGMFKGFKWFKHQFHNKGSTSATK